VAEARRVQDRLAKRVRLAADRRRVSFVAAVDAAFTDNRVFAAACLFSFPALELVEETTVATPLRFPYVPGFLSFREGEGLVQAVRRLSRRPDVILVDGQGIAHPRRIGIASHLGVILDIPTVGCAKSRLVGEAVEPGRRAGQWTPLRYQGKIVGAVVRTRDGTKPLFVSPGHRIGLAGSIRLAVSCTRGYRIPEPLRRADALSKKLRRSGRG
jgi:deoxyribonuclease V